VGALARQISVCERDVDCIITKAEDGRAMKEEPKKKKTEKKQNGEVLTNA
jgi:hypothetical protein